MAKKHTISTQDMIQSAERYLAQTKIYEDITMQRLADFLKVGVHIVYRRLPAPIWDELRHAWILNQLRQAMEAFCIAGKAQEDFTPENIASYAGMPSNTIDHSLTEREWQILLTTHSIMPQENVPSHEGSSISSYYLSQAERYLAQTEKYKMVTKKQFAAFLGQSENLICKQLPTYQWEILRHTWIQNRLEQAMDNVYADARTQEDFTLKNIARYAEIPYFEVRRLLPEDEWQTRRATLPKPQKVLKMNSDYIQQAEIYLAQTQCYEDVQLKRFAASMGKSPKTVSEQLSNHQWEQLRKTWIKNRLKQAKDAILAEAQAPTITSIARYTGIPPTTVRYHLSSKDKWPVHQKGIRWKDPSSLQRLQQAMDEVHAEAKTQEDVTISKLVEKTGISRAIIRKLIGDEWHNRRKMLPTTKEKVFAALQTLIDTGISLKELTRQRVVELADVNGEGTWSWFNQPYHAARRQIALRPTKQIAEPPFSANVRIIPGGWVDINENTWDLRPAGYHLLQRDKLRTDIADIVWPLLQDELRSPDVAPGTVNHHYFGFIKAGIFLGTEVLNVRHAVFSVVQCLWMNYQGTDMLRQLIRQCLVQIFEALASLAEHDDTIKGAEMLSISAWLQTAVKIGRASPGEDFLSESELNAVLRGCLVDITAGITYINTQPNLLTISVHPIARENAVVVVQWAVALMILIMAFTGLRRESILGIKINDWAEVHTSLFVLAWSHNKKREENISVLPADLAQLLQVYVHSTTPIRNALETEHVFLTNNIQGHWAVLPVSQFSPRLTYFTKRHHLERDGLPLPLNSTVLRRTYATRAIYEGRDISALRAQFGHIHFESTLRYVKFDQFEHPAKVCAPLDEYGRKALTLWQKPLLLDDLAPDERASLLGVKVKHWQDVGLCRHAQCVKAIQGSPPPCSLCEHLVTGPEFLDAWQAEYLWRKQALEQLAQEPELCASLAQMKSQFERFKANFVFVRERIHP